MFLLLDIGRTKFRLARSLDGETFGEPEIIPTPITVEEGIKIIVEAAREMNNPVTTVVIGASRKVWNGAPLAERVKAELITVPVYIENDAALAALGEAVVGAGRGCQAVAYVTVSTGVGGAKIENGQISQNTFGFEPGQQIITLDGQEARRLEDYVSGLAVEKRFGRPPHGLTDDKIWQDLSHYLAIGLTNTLLHWSPDCLVLGGSMFQDPGFKIATLESLIRRDLTIFPQLPLIKQATLGETSALHGALVYLKSLSRN